MSEPELLPILSPRTRPSNGAEWDEWSDRWCASCDGDRDEDCPIILTGLSGDEPVEWRRGPGWSMATIQFCTSYRPRREPA